MYELNARLNRTLKVKVIGADDLFNVRLKIPAFNFTHSYYTA
jgi:hypothetical protein